VAVFKRCHHPTATIKRATVGWVKILSVPSEVCDMLLITYNQTVESMRYLMPS